MALRPADIGGNTHTGQYRLRPRLFGVVLEELVITFDGSSQWVRVRSPVKISATTIGATAQF